MDSTEQATYIFRIVLELFVGLHMLFNIRYWKTDKPLVISLLAISIPLVFLSVIHTLIVCNVITADASRGYTGWVGFVLFVGMYAAFNRIQKLIRELLIKMIV